MMRIWRRRKTPQRLRRDRRPERDNRYERLIGTVAASSLMILLAKVVSTYVIAGIEGAPVALRLWRGFLPYLAILDVPSVFRTVVTHSTIVVAVAAALWQIRPLIKPRDRIYAWGRAAAVAAAVETYFLELLRHLFWDEVLRADRLWYAVFPLLGGLVLAAAAVLFSEPDDARTVSDEVGADGRSTRSLAPVT